MVKNINKNLHKIFLLALVFAQTIAFVSVWAEVNGSVSASFFSPMNNQQINIGESITIQAQVQSTFYPLRTVHFILTAENTNVPEVSFQAYNTGSIWVADSAWNTTNYLPGIYHLSVAASSYDDNGNIVNYSRVGTISVSLVDANDADIPGDAEVDPVLPTVSVVHPVANEVISGQYQAQVIVANPSTYTLKAVLQRNNNDLTSPRTAESNSLEQLIFFINTTSTTDGEAQLVFFVEQANNTDRQILATVNVQINNSSTETPDEPLSNPTISAIVSPENNNLTISGDHYPLAMRLNRGLISGETAGATLYSGNSAVQNINLILVGNNTYRGYFNSQELPDGRYQVVFWFNNGQRVVLHNSYYLNIDNPDQEQPAEGVQAINLVEPIGEINSDSFILRLRTSLPAVSLLWNLAYENDSVIASNGSMTRSGDGQDWSQSINLPRSVFINGSYRLVVQVTDSVGQIQQAAFSLLLNRSERSNQPASPADEPNESGEDDEALPPTEDSSDAESIPNDQGFDVLPDEVRESEVGDDVIFGQPTDEQRQSSSNESVDPRCQERNIDNQENCLQWLALFSEDIDRQCLEENIYDVLACEDYLNRITVDRQCQEKNIFDRVACQDYLMEEYSPEVSCRLGDDALCQDILRNTYLNRLVVRQQRSDKLENVIKPLVGQTINSVELSQQLSEQNLEEILPVKTGDKIKFLLINSHPITALINNNKLETVNSAILALDTDGDGLPNDLENYYQTDQDNIDTDGDGYLDGEEIATNHNPLGDGELLVERTAFDRVILSDLPLEQPKVVTDKTEANWQITEPASQDGSLLLSGQAEPNSWAMIYIYSDLPLIMLAKTDASGNWSYAIGDALADGEHKVYVTVNDDTGRIVKQSEPLSFLIKGAQAVTVDEYFSPTVAGDKVNNFILYYLLGAGFLIIIALGILFYLHRDKGSIDLTEQSN